MNGSMCDADGGGRLAIAVRQISDSLPTRRLRGSTACGAWADGAPNSKISLHAGCWLLVPGCCVSVGVVAQNFKIGTIWPGQMTLPITTGCDKIPVHESRLWWPRRGA